MLDTEKLVVECSILISQLGTIILFSGVDSPARGEASCRVLIVLISQARENAETSCARNTVPILLLPQQMSRIVVKNTARQRIFAKSDLVPEQWAKIKKSHRGSELQSNQTSLARATALLRLPAIGRICFVCVLSRHSTALKSDIFSLERRSHSVRHLGAASRGCAVAEPSLI